MADKIFSPVRVRAATQEAAIAQALQMTGASREDVEFEVLEETEQGVTIRIVPQGTLAAKEETPAQSTSAPEETEEEPEEAPIETQEPEDTTQAALQEEIASEPEAVEQNAPVEDAFVEEEEESAAPAPAPSASDEDEDQAEDEVQAESENHAEDEEEETPAAAVVRAASPEVVEHARFLAQEMLDHMGLEAQAHSGDLPDWCLPAAPKKSAKSERTRDVPRAFLNIEGEDVGILIGKHGQTLQSFQYLLNLSLNNTADEEEPSADGVRSGGVHVVVDAGEYRERRASALKRTALDTSVRAKRDRRSIRMEPMPAHERRLVHLALVDDRDIITSSEGREPWRRVVVTPTGVRTLRGSERGEDRSGGSRKSERPSGGRGRSGGNSGGQRSYGSSAGGTSDARRGYN